MQKYGKLEDGNLLQSSQPLEGYKPIVFEQIPEDFDQTTHYIVQSVPMENENHIYLGIEIFELQLDEGENLGEEFVL